MVARRTSGPDSISCRSSPGRPLFAAVTSLTYQPCLRTPAYVSAAGLYLRRGMTLYPVGAAIPIAGEGSISDARRRARRGNTGTETHTHPSAHPSKTDHAL